MRVLHNASIRTKLSTGFGIALALVVAIGALGIVQLRAVNAVTEDIRRFWLPRIEAVGEIKRAAGELRLMAARRMQATDFRSLAVIVRAMRATSERLDADLKSYEAAAGLAGDGKLVVDFRKLWKDYGATIQEIEQKLEAGELSAARVQFAMQSQAVFDDAIGVLDRLAAFAKERTAVAAARAEEIEQRAHLLTLLAIVFAALVTFVAILWTARHVSSPILKVSEAMRRLTAGDHSVVVPQDSGRGDEIGTLYAAAAGYRDSLIRTRELAQEAEQERNRLHAAISNMPIGLCMFDSARRLIICNSRYGEIYALSSHLTRPGTPLAEILRDRVRAGNFAGTDPDRYVNELLEWITGGRARREIIELNDGRTLSITYQPMHNGGWVATHEDISERRRAEARIRHMARHDALTDLPNRVLFRERVEEALKRVSRGEKVAVLCLDLDRFKSVNDTLGHPFGDRLLQTVADRLQETVRESDTVARFGGDEFAVVQVDAEQPQGATMLAQRLIDALSKSYEIDDHQVVIGASIGIAIAPMDGANADQLLKNGDMALYRAKADGRGVYRFFEPEMDARMQARRALELDLRKALMENEFEVHYQPVVDVRSEDVTSFEALLRWHHPQRGMVPPDDFIPLAEEIGLIVPIGERVLRQACRDAMSWPEHVRVAVNLSPAQFRSKKLIETVITALAVSGLPAERLELEITEGVLLMETEATLSLLHQLRALGVRIAMDDFGTGYSSLSYLRSFPFDKIKIDRSFIRNISDESSSVAIIRAVTGLSASLGMATTAEGVETREQLDRVRAEGCTEVQGFLFSAAKPAQEVGAMLDALVGQKEAAA